MKIHHLNCGTLCPFGGRLMDGFSGGLSGRLVCHCLLIEGPDGLILVDTGFGLQDVIHPEPRLSRFFLKALRPVLDTRSTAVSQVRALGFSTGDVRDIIVTHLDFDHAGGLDDFPRANVHLMAAEAEAVRERSTWIARGRYRPEQLTTMGQWKTYEEGGSGWFGFRAVRDLEGLPPEILLVPLAGHTLGHAGVAIDTGDGWLLHAGDAYFYRGEILPRGHRCTPGLTAYQRMMEVDRPLRRLNQRRLRELIGAHGGEVTVFSAHDAIEFRDMGGVPVSQPSRFSSSTSRPA